MQYIFAALGTALILNLASPPLDWGFAAAFLFLPLFPILNASPGKRFLTGWLAGFLAQALAYYWIFFTVRDFGGQNNAISLTGAILFQLYQGLDLALWLLFTPIIFKKTHPAFLPFGAAAFFVVLQTWLFPYVFPWDYGSLFANAPGLAGAAAGWSSRGLAFFMLLLQGLVWTHRAALKKQGPLFISILALLMSGHLFQGSGDTEVWRIGVVQPNLIRHAKRGGLSYNDIFQAHLRPGMSMARDHLDLMLWPESAIAFDLEHFPHYESRLRQMVRDMDAPLISGTISRRADGGYQNEIRMFTPDGEEPQVYVKEKLVMFSEQLPLVFSWAKKFDPNMGAFRPGTHNRPFLWRDRAISPLICFEALFPEYAGKHASHLMVNLTNDAWFGETKASSQHLQQIRLRAVEQRIPLVRATNSGITCWVDANGEIQGPGGLYETETFIYEVPVPKTPSRRFGYFGGRLIMGVSLILVIWGLIAGWRNRDLTMAKNH